MTSLTSTAIELNLMHGLTAVPINKLVGSRFTSGSGTYSPTTGMVFVYVRIFGAGGGGGGCTGASGQSAAGGGGASGATAEFIMTAAQIGAGVSYAVGAAGTAGANTGGTGGTGGNTTFSDWTAQGGAGGVGCTASASSQVIAGGAANSVVIGTGFLITAYAGSPGGYGFTLTTTLAMPGYGPCAAYQGNFAPPTPAISAGANTGTAVGVGAGGSGASTLNTATAAIGGSGAIGRILLIEYLSA